jgi:hypothetical protein
MGIEMNDELDESDNLMGTFSQAIDQAIRDNLYGKPERLVRPALITVLASFLLAALHEFAQSRNGTCRDFCHLRRRLFPPISGPTQAPTSSRSHEYIALSRTHGRLISGRATHDQDRLRGRIRRRHLNAAPIAVIPFGWLASASAFVVFIQIGKR